MCGIPEQWDGLGKDKAVLDVPVDLFREGLADFQRMAEEAFQGAAGFGHMDVGDLVEGHEDGGEEGVHQHTDAEGHEKLAPAEVAGKPFSRLAVE